MSSFAVNIVVSLTLGAGTDYGIFLMGRYHEARQLGESREEAYYTAYRGVSPIIIGSGLTIAGSCFCLSFARLDYFHTMGPAVAISMLFTIAAALTLAPALLTLGSLFGLFDPKKPERGRLYRRIGASVVRWPVPILVASWRVVMLGAIFVPTYSVRLRRPGVSTRHRVGEAGIRGLGSALPAEQAVHRDDDGRIRPRHAQLGGLHLPGPGGQGAERLPGVAMVQSITRPLGRPLDHANIPYLFTVRAVAPASSCRSTSSRTTNTDQQAQIQAAHGGHAAAGRPST